jgi:hypothetical protein
MKIRPDQYVMFLCRGTKSVHDLLTDIGLESAPFLDSYAHGSIVKATEVNILSLNRCAACQIAET